MSRLSLLATVGILLAMVSCAQRPSAAAAGSIHRRCSAAIRTLSHSGSRLVELDQDGHGHAIELWCTNGIVTSQWDLRVGQSKRSDTRQAAVAPPPRSALTIGGCFFDNGTNTGPAIRRDPDGAFATVVWINRSAFGEPRTYRFSYDFHTGLVTITLTTSCGQQVSKVVPPQASYAKMAALLPDPPRPACRQRTPDPDATPP
jgi:hypothetical protein